MNRKDFKLDRKKVNMQDFKKKEKENRKLQLELNQEKEKFNQMVIKYQKELNEMQAVRLCFTVVLIDSVIHSLLILSLKGDCPLLGILVFNV